MTQTRVGGVVKVLLTVVVAGGSVGVATGSGAAGTTGAALLALVLVWSALRSANDRLRHEIEEVAGPRHY
jgi:hypothetical protein